ncbi:MAG TPA: 3-isopropylmalate dehydrogenase [Candidatus Limenecus avicola]|uniref:3-isopropylmalate dehydrogenase n=1 Tax=Candidatus Limenecus avicola TaxID=2840847 RepID=A0A9D1MYL6_9CLOT|nr:3-isopropylmalate dehydrogenase [Candidatus Limenecus avicola]
MKNKIALLGGDGIGPAVIDEGVKILNAIEKKYGIQFEYERALIGGCAYDDCKKPLPDSTISTAKAADAVYLGAVGDWKYDTLPSDLRPEKALLGIRKELNLFANLRPAIVFDELLESSTLKPEVVKGVDIMMVRELTGDVYFGQPRGIEMIDGQRAGFNNMIYYEKEVERIAHVAFQTAMKRNKKLCSVDKANVLDSSRLWREVITTISNQYPQVELTHMYVDNAAMQLIRNPKQFDVVVTGNIFGDILSDEASMLSGSLGMLPSASLSDKNPGMYEPIHGSAPDLKGKNTVNPIATILSAAMMMRYSFGLDEAAIDIENAVKSVLKKGYRTQDIFSQGTQLVGTTQMGDLIAKEILS